MSQTELAIAIPFYRGPHFLRQAIQSVLAQTNPLWLLTVSDDGGTEPGARELVESFADPRIRYSLSPSRLGMVGNWNRCLELARVSSPSIKYISLLHADDEWMPNYVQTITEGWKQFPGAAALFCKPEIIDENGQSVFSFPDFYKRLLVPGWDAPRVLAGETGLHALIRGNFIFCPTLCYRASLPGLQFRSEWKMVQDLDFTASLLLQGEQLVGLPTVAYRYRRHANNATQAYTNSLLRFEEEFKLLNELKEKAQQRGWQQAARAAKRATIVHLHLMYRIALDTVGLRFADAIKKTRFLLRKRARTVSAKE
jgi:glycosyltransferase involved in cell wall biosynthesis